MENYPPRSSVDTTPHSRIFNTGAFEATNASTNTGSMASRDNAHLKVAHDSIRSTYRQNTEERTQVLGQFSFPSASDLFTPEFEKSCFSLPKDRVSIGIERQSNVFLDQLFTISQDFQEAAAKLDPRFKLVLRLKKLINSGYSEDFLHDVQEYQKDLLLPFVFSEEYLEQGDYLNYAAKFNALSVFFFKYYDQIHEKNLANISGNSVKRDSEFLRRFGNLNRNIVDGCWSFDRGQYVVTPFAELLSKVEQLEQQTGDHHGLIMYLAQQLVVKDYKNAQELFSRVNTVLLEPVFNETFRRTETSFFSEQALSYSADGLIIAVLKSIIKGVVWGRLNALYSTTSKHIESESNPDATPDLADATNAQPMFSPFEAQLWLERNLGVICNVWYLVEKKTKFLDQLASIGPKSLNKLKASNNSMATTNLVPGDSHLARILQRVINGTRVVREASEFVIRKSLNQNSKPYLVNKNECKYMFLMLLQSLGNNGFVLPVNTTLNRFLEVFLGSTFEAHVDDLLNNSYASEVTSLLAGAQTSFQNTASLRNGSEGETTSILSLRIKGEDGGIITDKEKLKTLLTHNFAKWQYKLLLHEFLTYVEQIAHLTLSAQIKQLLVGPKVELEAIKFNLNNRDAVWVSELATAGVICRNQILGKSLDASSYVRFYLSLPLNRDQDEVEANSNQGAQTKYYEFLVIFDAHLKFELYKRVVTTSSLKQEQKSSKTNSTPSFGKNLEPMTSNRDWDDEDYFVPQDYSLEDFEYVICEAEASNIEATK